MKRPEIVNRISKAIHQVAPTVQTILYGSEARGDARKDSDFYQNVMREGVIL